ncbi:phosphotransferase family protein [Celeribacter sp.]|uniref:phosphotransferase family protein n=1 Tax=Celeribacter sp. TaxID=1890673 RepID=UPI003A95B99E
MTIARPPSQVIENHARSLLGASVVWQHLAGGRTNSGWVGRSKNRAVVYKLYRADRANPLFPNDPSQEWACLSALIGTGLAPQPVAQFEAENGRIVAYEFVTGDVFAQTTSRIIKALHLIHTTTPPMGIRTLPLGADRLLTMGDQLLDGLDTGLSQHVRERRPKPVQMPEARAVFLHGDPVPANVIKTQTGICFLDWQCPATGDAVDDLYVALSPAMHRIYGSAPLTEDREEAALSAYPDAGTIARFRAIRPCLAWRMAAYCVWKAARGETDYADCVALELSRV